MAAGPQMIFRHQGRHRYLSIFPPHHLRATLPALQLKATVRKPRRHVRTLQRRRRRRPPQRSMHNLVCLQSIVYHLPYLHSLIRSSIHSKLTGKNQQPHQPAQIPLPALLNPHLLPPLLSPPQALVPMLRRARPGRVPTAQRARDTGGVRSRLQFHHRD